MRPVVRPASNFMRFGVIMTVLGAMGNALATLMLVAFHQQGLATSSPGPHGRFVTMALAAITAVTYLLVVRRSPSAVRWVWCWIVVGVMAVYVAANMRFLPTTTRVYTWTDAVVAAVAGLIIAWPLLRFYNRPAKHS